MDINYELRRFIVDVNEKTQDHDAINKRLDKIVKRKLEQRYDHQMRLLKKQMEEN